MLKQRQQGYGKVDEEAKSGRQSPSPFEEEVLTPGREPAEGPDVAMKTPTHERWEQHTAERAPAEGPAAMPQESEK